MTADEFNNALNECGKQVKLDLPLLVLHDILYQQREQLKETEQRNKLHGAPAFEMRKKAIANLENGIKELEFGIKILTESTLYY